MSKHYGATENVRRLGFRWDDPDPAEPGAMDGHCFTFADDADDSDDVVVHLGDDDDFHEHLGEPPLL